MENRIIPQKNALDSSSKRSINGVMTMSQLTPGAGSAPPVTADPFAAFTESFAPKRAVSYLRVSTREQAERGGREEGFSIPAQRDANKKKATSMGAMVAKEFVERGVSGTSTNRPALQEMLRYLEEESGNIDYVIVHKVDRLARNRADDVTLNARFDDLGIRLVSTSENIDQTPGGMLLHGIMSSIAEFYSRNLANEVLKGMTEKVKAGGSIGRAPIGYRNIRVLEGSSETRTVALDEQRAEHVQWAFAAYAEDGWTVATLVDELNRRGLTTVPTPKLPERPIGIRQVHHMLTNPFYTGVVTFKRAKYPGSHEPLIDTETFAKVQTILGSRLTGERSRKHDHYLKSSVICSTCGSRLIVQHTRSGGNGEIYEYYSCGGRHAKRTSCNFRSIQIPHLEQLIEDLYRRISLDPLLRLQMETLLRASLKEMQRSEHDDRKRLEKAKLQLERKQQKLLEAHYNDAIPVDLLSREQKKLDTELNKIRRELSGHQTNTDRGERIITMALDLCEDMGQKYRRAPEHIRRLLNQVLFEQIKVVFDEHDGEWAVEADYTPEFAFLTSSGIRTAAREYAIQTNKPTEKGGFASDTDDEVLIHLVKGSNKSTMVDPARIELATSCLQSRRSTN